MPVGAGEGDGAAYNAEVLTTATEEELRQEMVRRGLLPLVGQQLRERLADEAEQAVEVIQGKLDGLKAALATKKAEAKQLRAEANEGAEG